MQERALDEGRGDLVPDEVGCGGEARDDDGAEQGAAKEAPVDRVEQVGLIGDRLGVGNHAADDGVVVADGAGLALAELDCGDEAAVEVRVLLFGEEGELFVIAVLGDRGDEGAQQEEAGDGGCDGEEDLAGLERQFEKGVGEDECGEQEDRRGDGDDQAPGELGEHKRATEGSELGG